MKKTQLLIIALLVGSIVNAQQFGIHAGINLAKGSGEAVDFPGIDKPSLACPLFGVVADFPLSKDFHFRPELNYIQKGFKRQYSEPGFGSATISAKLNYIELPLNLAYAIPAGNHKVLLGAGPTIGFGLSGKTKQVFKEEGQPTETEEDDVSFGSDADQDDLKPLDLGFNILAAFQMKQGFFAKTGYNFGISNISHDDESEFRNKGFFISIGYMFGKKK